MQVASDDNDQTSPIMDRLSLVSLMFYRTFQRNIRTALLGGLLAVCLSACTSSRTSTVTVDLGMSMSATVIASIGSTEWDQVTVSRRGAELVQFDPLYILPSTRSFKAQGRLEKVSERVELIERLFASGPTNVSVFNRKAGDGRLDCHTGKACVDRALAALGEGSDGAWTRVEFSLVREQDEPGGLLVSLSGIVGKAASAISVDVIFDAEEFDALLKETAKASP